LSLKIKNVKINKGFVSHGQVTRHKNEEMRTTYFFFPLQKCPWFDEETYINTI